MKLSYAHPSSCPLKTISHCIGFMRWVWPAPVHPVAEAQPFPWGLLVCGFMALKT